MPDVLIGKRLHHCRQGTCMLLFGHAGWCSRLWSVAACCRSACYVSMLTARRPHRMGAVGKLRDELLNVEVCDTLLEVKVVISLRVGWVCWGPYPTGNSP